MTHRIVAGAFVLALWTGAGSAALAEDGAAAPPAEAQKTTAESAYDALEAEFAEARKAYAEATRARPKGEPWPEGWKPPPRPESVFAARYLAAAVPFAGTSEAVPFLLKAASLGRSYDKDASRAAIEELVRAHAASPRLADLTYTLIYGSYSHGEEFVRDAMTKIADANPDPAVGAAMLYARGTLVNRRGARDAAESAAAVADLRRSIELAPGSRYAEMAAGNIFELENLQVGMPAPEIEGADLDGVAFRLSDYRGKVVLLDFWGDW